MISSTSRRLPRLLVLVLLAVGLAFACAPTYSFVDGQGEGGTGANPPGIGSTCRADADCVSESVNALCDLASGFCVECVPEREAEATRCGSGLYCAEDETCTIGCTSNEDCRGKSSCDPASHACTGCSGSEDCPIGTTCADGVCQLGCQGGTDCPNGWNCCTGVCRNPLTSATDCGACGTDCGAGNDCLNGSCGTKGCRTGHAECDEDLSDLCETDIRSDPANCGRCGKDCGDDLCSGGKCTAMTCPAERADCDNTPENGCEVNLTSVANCTMCGAACSSTNGTPACDESGCSITCLKNFGDCDDRTSNGCETELADDAEHCGACDVACSNEHGSTACEAGKCQPLCASGFDDCDGEPSTGCETDLGSSLESCGFCGNTCNVAHGGEQCELGVCKLNGCDAGFEDCDGDVKTGCEADFSKPETCGSCANGCSDNGGKAGCTASGACTLVCARGRANCTGGLADGCETDVGENPRNCGECGRVCPSAGGTPTCHDGECGFSTCTSPSEDCNHDVGQADSDGCETNLSNDALNCGVCTSECFFANATGKCVNKGCVLDECRAGHADCSGGSADGCETDITTTQHCKSCGVACSNAHGSTSCTATGCEPVCALGWSDCNSDPNDGCETPLDTLSDCGACGVRCSRSHASATCASGTCEIDGCTSGWEDCDSEPVTKNGCETNVFSLSNCGACGVPCDPVNASGSCAAGLCVQGACDPGYVDCNGGAGCETKLGQASNCSACDNACSNAHGSNACSGTVGAYDCAPTCQDGWKSCDSNPDNGCERNVRTTTDCGDCNIGCEFPNAAATCSTGTCAMGACGAGFADCGAGAGCETTLGSSSNCAACGNTCVNVHGSTSCTGAAGSFACAPVCISGWKSCDGNLDNGCETDATTASNCGSCGAVCGGGTPMCVNGACVSARVNSATGGKNSLSTKLDVSHTLQTAAGGKRLVVALIGSDGNNQGTSKPSSVLYNGTPMTLGPQMWSSNRVTASMYYIKDADLPAPGTYTVSVSGGEFGKVLNVYELRGIDQTTPIDATGGSKGNNCGADDPIDPITTVTANAFVISTVVTFGSNVGTPESGQTQSYTNTGGGMGFAAGYLQVGATGLRSIAWDMSTCDVSLQLLVALRAAP